MSEQSPVAHYQRPCQEESAVSRPIQEAKLCWAGLRYITDKLLNFDMQYIQRGLLQIMQIYSPVVKVAISLLTGIGYSFSLLLTTCLNRK